MDKRIRELEQMILDEHERNHRLMQKLKLRGVSQFMIKNIQEQYEEVLEKQIQELNTVLSTFEHSSDQLSEMSELPDRYPPFTPKKQYVPPQGFSPQEDSVGCAVCGTPSSKRCANCKDTAYCSQKCQAINWHIHSKICK
jgi:hypothetical protein